MINILYVTILKMLNLVIEAGFLGIILLFLIICLLYFCFTFKLKIQTYKIKNFSVTIMYSLLYMLFFILYILALRFIRIVKI